MQLVVDECPDANGNWTIRPADGSPNGDIEAPPIATVYDLATAQELVEAFNQVR